MAVPALAVPATAAIGIIAIVGGVIATAILLSVDSR